jgi:hypothetical protein
MEELTQYLDAVGRRSWRWGEVDCLMMLADWVQLRCGVDPATGIRGSYSTEEESLALIRRFRGIAGCIDHCVAPFGIERTVEPSAGDISVAFAGIKRRGRLRRGLTGAICIKPGLWVVKKSDGVDGCEL